MEMCLERTRFTLIKLKYREKLSLSQWRPQKKSWEKFVSAIKYEDRQSKEVKELKTDGVFVAIGYAPNSGIVKDLVKINEQGKLSLTIKRKNFFGGYLAAGDITDILYGQINVAIGDAIKAVLNINDYFKNRNENIIIAVLIFQALSFLLLIPVL